MLIGLGDFRACSWIKELPAELERTEARLDPGRVAPTLELGEEDVQPDWAEEDPERLYGALVELVGEADNRGDA